MHGCLLWISLVALISSIGVRSWGVFGFAVAAFVAAAIFANRSPPRQGQQERSYGLPPGPEVPVMNPTSNRTTSGTGPGARGQPHKAPRKPVIIVGVADLPNFKRDAAALDAFLRKAPDLGRIQLVWGHRSEYRKEIASYSDADIQRFQATDSLLRRIQVPDPRVVVLPLTWDKKLVVLGPGVLISTAGDLWDPELRHWFWRDLTTTKAEALIREPADQTPPGADVIAETWLHVRVDGTPDRRYSSNPRANVVQYIDLRLHNKGEVVLHMRLISERAADIVDRLISGRSSEGSARPASSSARSAPPPHPPTDGPSKRTAHEVLGVPVSADQATIRKAYIELVKQYHPDRVANLAPEIKELAGRRMREINRAYEEIGGT